MRRSDYALANFGDDLKKHYGWACGVTNQKPPNFEHLEKLAGRRGAVALQTSVPSCA